MQGNTSRSISLNSGTLNNDLLSYLQMSSVYYLKDMQEASFNMVNKASSFGQRFAVNPFVPLSYTTTGRLTAASLDLLERYTHRYRKPHFGIDSVVSSSGQIYNIEEEVVKTKTFCRLIHFKRSLIESEFSKNKKFGEVPTILIVAPYSGHYATLLGETVGSLLKDHEVYITDWENARNVTMAEGNFTLEDYIQYLIDFIHLLKTDLHVVAVCQPAVPVLAVTALLAANNDPHQPKSIILMGGPIDTRVNPTKVNQLAKAKKLDWFESTVIGRVPLYYSGALRRVCPGFLMLSGFMSLNLERHMMAPADLFKHLVQGDQESADAHKRFYDEFRSVLDLPADYFLHSVQVAFQEHDLPRGTMKWKGEIVDLKAIQKTALLTIEGERDDISGVGQTEAAHALCPNIPRDKKRHHLQKGVGHYGVFNGRRWREDIAPVIHDFIRNQPQQGRLAKVV